MFDSTQVTKKKKLKRKNKKNFVGKRDRLRVIGLFSELDGKKPVYDMSVYARVLNQELTKVIDGDDGF